jgi:hypothetical protein
VPPGEGFQITGTAAPAEDAEHSHQPQEPLRVTDPTPVAAVRDGLEEADQVIRCGLSCCGRGVTSTKSREPNSRLTASSRLGLTAIRVTLWLRTIYP